MNITNKIKISRIFNLRLILLITWTIWSLQQWVEMRAVFVFWLYTPSFFSVRKHSTSTTYFEHFDGLTIHFWFIKKKTKGDKRETVSLYIVKPKSRSYVHCIPPPSLPHTGGVMQAEMRLSALHTPSMSQTGSHSLTPDFPCNYKYWGHGLICKSVIRMQI